MVRTGWLVAAVLLALSLGPGCYQKTAQPDGKGSDFASVRPPIPEPKGGCQPKSFIGACISTTTDPQTGEEKRDIYCVTERLECPTNKQFQANDDRCQATLSCPKVDQVDASENEYIAKVFLQPPRGGSNEATQTHNPRCDPGRFGAHCTWSCIQANPGFQIVPGSVTLWAKEAGPKGCYSDWIKNEPEPDGYRHCARGGGDCIIQWSGWEELKVNKLAACARFKNWSHDRARCAKIQATVAPL